MFENFQLILTAGALVIVSLGIMALLIRFLLAPLMALLAIPTYAAMIATEYFVVSQYPTRCPEFLKFKRPKTYWKKVCMDFFATYCTMVGSQIALRLFGSLQVGRGPDDGFTQIITHASDSAQFFIIALFWAFLIGTYVVSCFHGDNPEHPINKLEDLVIPEWATKMVEKVKG